MANYDDVLQIFKDCFNDIHECYCKSELNDRVYIEIQNDKYLSSLVSQKTPSAIWQAIQTAIKNVVNGILEYNEKPRNVSLEQCKKAIKAVFGADFYEIMQPTFNYYYKNKF